ncbi:Asr1405/Asl0597 family protein [Chamaesiphon sp.]|uniref:Asr1405/Asl0597 family protein n=1 Tax=Chamaesiphon sp. TaxID=2814140 RepID=UPI003592F300
MEKVNYPDWILVIDTVWGDRWQIHRRLTELKIPCKCSTGQLLVVTVDTPTAAIQVWSVARQPLAGRSQLVNWLDRCFDLDVVGAASAGRENCNSSELLYD